MNGTAVLETFSPRTTVTVYRAIGADLLSSFLDYLDSSPKTVETYSRALRQLFKYLSRNGIKRPVREDIISYREELKATGHRPTTVQNYITAAKIFFSWTAQEGIYPNVAEHLKGAKISRDHKKDYLTGEQVKEVLEGMEGKTLAGLRDYAILLIMVTCGLRTIEVSRANIGDLRTLGGHTVLYVQGKGREEKAEFVKISAPVERAVRAYLKQRGESSSEAPLFASTSNNNRGKRMTTRSISGIVKSSFLKAGFNSDRLTAHSLRHTAVTLSLLAGQDITEVQQFARHANISTTMIYNHALDASKNGCVEAITKAIL